MAPAAKANYKSYESQARMVRAIVAAHPEVKWNYKDIAKFFGESTADGIQFQFRSVKKDAEKLRDAVSKGENPATSLNLNAAGGGGTLSSTSTPRARGTPAKPRASGTTGSGKSAKRRKRVDLSDDEDEDELDFDELDTPTKAHGRERVIAGRVTKSRTPNATPSSSFNNNGTAPSRAAPTVAAALLSNPIDLTGSESEVNTPENVAPHEEEEERKPIPDAPHVEPASIFGDPASFSQASGPDQWFGGMSDDASFNQSFAPYDSYAHNSYMDAEGEI